MFEVSSEYTTPIGSLRMVEVSYFKNKFQQEIINDFI